MKWVRLQHDANACVDVTFFFEVSGGKWLLE